MIQEINLNRLVINHNDKNLQIREDIYSVFFFKYKLNLK
jgi:hypothetical protein